MKGLHRFTVRAGAIGAAAVTFTVLGAGAALAHECYVANRSAQGNASAGSHSQAWLTISVSDFAHSGEEFPAELADCFLANWFAGGGPESFTVHVKGANGSGGTIGDNNPNTALHSDGRGIDHIEDTWLDLFVASLTPCLGS